MPPSSTSQKKRVNKPYMPAVAASSSVKKPSGNARASTRMSHGPGLSDTPTTFCGGWGRLPNVSPIDYADDDPRGWVLVTRNKRNRGCRIQDEEDA